MHTLKLLTLLALAFLSTTPFAQVGMNGGVLNPNLAEESELAKLPGMTSELADMLIGARPLASNLALQAVLGDALDEKAKSRLRTRLFLPINLNDVSEDELMLVPGIDRRMAHEFEEYKPYSSIEQFRREIGKYVSSQEVSRYEQFVFVPINLNSASAEVISTIPGMSRKMVHEFEEYRPYKSIEQFRREIGKYVDEAEVTRLERYVFVD